MCQFMSGRLYSRRTAFVTSVYRSSVLMSRPSMSKSAARTGGKDGVLDGQLRCIRVDV